MRGSIGSLGIALAALCVLSAGSSFAAYSVPADTLFYGGDYNGVNGLWSIDGNGGYSGTVYQNFVVPAGSVWEVHGVFGYYGFSTTPESTASWEIRSGVSTGNGGTLVASGTAVPAVMTATGGFLWGYAAEYEVEVRSLNVTLGPGTYWVGLRPSDSTGNGYLETTSGANAVGIPGGYVSAPYFSGASFGHNFDPAQDLSPDFGRFSIGVAGLVPEPAGVMLVVAGGLVLTRRYRRSAK